MTKEEWRPVRGYEGLYSVSSLGRVRSEAHQIVRSNGRVQTFRERIRKTHINLCGYPAINLRRGGTCKTRAVHVLVCEAFRGPRPAGMEAAHWNGNSSDPAATNLRWATPAENNADKIGHGTLYQGQRHHWSKLSDEVVNVIRGSGELQRVLAAQYGTTQGNVSAIQRGVSRKAA